MIFVAPWKLVWMSMIVAGLSFGTQSASQAIECCDTPATYSVSNSRLRKNSSRVRFRQTRCSTNTVAILPQDELWLIVARNSHCDPCDLSSIRVRRLIDNCWTESCLADLVSAHASDKSKSTMMYVHGNRTDEDWAMDRGLLFYKNCFSTTACVRPPLRFVVFAWKSDKIGCRPLKDYQIKSQRSIVVGQALANVLGQFGDRNLSLVGFSLGVQSILSSLDCQTATPAAAATRPGQYQVCLIAPALDGEYASRQRCRVADSSLVANADIFTNHSDGVLRLSGLVRRRQAPGGDTSIVELANYGRLPLNGIRIRDVACDQNGRHSVESYTEVAVIQDSLNQMLNAVLAGSAVPTY